MKSQTHYQVKTQIAGQIGNKKQQYLPHKWRGNTLVPVIIALAISAIATIAFLTQGANLAESNKVLVAQNEIASLIADWGVAKEAYSGNRSQIPSMYPATNITYGLRIGYTPPTGNAITDTATLEYDTDTASSCSELRGKISTTIPEVSSVSCATNNATPPVISRLTVLLQ